MDPTLQVTFLTLGVMLLLVGLIGQVKAKEIEVGTKNPIVRVLVGLIGLLFIGISFSGRLPLASDTATSFTPTNSDLVKLPDQTLTPSTVNMPEFNLFDHAQDAVWTGNDDINKKIPWMSMTYKIFSPTVDICYDRLEDGQEYPKTIFTHPAWKDDGYVQGEFNVPIVGKGQHFLADVGFWDGAQSPTARNPGDGVEIYVFFQGDLIYRRIKYNTASLLPIDVDMVKYESAPGSLIIKVTANGGSGQDQFCWVNPRIAVP